MWDFEIAGIRFFNVFYNFFIYSFIGWIYESIYVSVCQKKWVNRGFLNGPVIPIYGATATLLYIAFFNDHMIAVTQEGGVWPVVVIYVVGMLLASFLEFVTSYTMEKIFHAKWWDYSECFLNIQGRVCLKASLFWGFLSVIMARYVQPAMGRVVDRLQRPLAEYAGYLIFAVFAGDFALTVAATLKLDRVLGRMASLREELYEAVEGRKWHELKEEFRGKLEASKLSDYLEELKENSEKRREEWKENSEERLDDLKERLEEKKQKRGAARMEYEMRRRQREEKLKKFIAQYDKKREGRLQEHIFRRWVRAYPNMKAKNRSGVLRDLKEKLQNKKNGKVKRG